MINKLPKEFVDKLTIEEQELLKNTFDSEAKNIRESVEKKMIKPSEFKILEQQANKYKLDLELINVPSENKELIADFVGNDINKLEEVKTKYPHLFETKTTRLIDIEGIIKNGVDIQQEPNLQALEERYISGEKLSKAEEELLFSQTIEKALNT